MGELIAAPAVTGIGGGAMMALGATTIGDIFLPRQRGRWMGLIAWARTLEQAQSDFDCVLVPFDARLLDIWRHPQDAIDRSDLQLAQG
jgi:hypothetical protein